VTRPRFPPGTHAVTDDGRLFNSPTFPQTGHYLLQRRPRLARAEGDSARIIFSSLVFETEGSITSLAACPG
jgi:hypothetical protein